ncbi:acyl-CoA thioesterase [Methylomonas sp. CM2]|uniref:acyl-CoA thioesterase n=1 Tax=Methylomonas sp. CM2 TaxID=3417647 RepID=UPI003CF2F50F
MTKSVLEAEVAIDIPFHDVDMMAVAWHGHYCKYFEVARCALLDKIAYNYPQMRDSGFAWPLVDIRIRYVKPARFGQRVLVRARLSEWEHRLKIDYLILDQASGDRLTKGCSVQVAVDLNSGELCWQSPPVLLAKLGLVSPCSD